MRNSHAETGPAEFGLSPRSAILRLYPLELLQLRINVDFSQGKRADVVLYCCFTPLIVSLANVCDAAWRSLADKKASPAKGGRLWPFAGFIATVSHSEAELRSRPALIIRITEDNRMSLETSFSPVAQASKHQGSNCARLGRRSLASQNHV